MYKYEFIAINKKTGDSRRCFFICTDDKEFKKKSDYWLENCNVKNVRKFKNK